MACGLILQQISVIYKELHIEYKSTKNWWVHGSIDIGAGVEVNGQMPYINIEGKHCCLYFESLGEAKRADIRLGRTTGPSSQLSRLKRSHSANARSDSNVRSNQIC